MHLHHAAHARTAATNGGGTSSHPTHFAAIANLHAAAYANHATPAAYAHAAAHAIITPRTAVATHAAHATHRLRLRTSPVSHLRRGLRPNFQARHTWTRLSLHLSSPNSMYSEADVEYDMTDKLETEWSSAN